MSNDKMREEFEAWARDHRVYDDEGESLPMDFLTGCYYEHVQTQAAWEAWQASREAQEKSEVSPEFQAMLSFFEAGEEEEIRMAEAFVRESDRCSISALQRKFKIGYNRACRLMDRLVALKVVSPIDAEGRRTVLPEQVKP